MQPLEKSLRNMLEKTVKDAHDIAEDAARAALEQLGVGEPTAYPHLTETNRKLRRKLRAHGRQLGNGRNAKGEQALDRLIEEVAYEHWHRMLFARFLAENNLLMYPDPDNPVAVTLEECEDLAADEGASNGWELASRYAARMLPQIFRPDSPVFQLTLPPEHQQKLECLIADLSKEVFTASDSLGWVYQFWQAKKKDEINASEVKIGARELPAVTQLFTEPYMVSFLLDNSLGAWWAARRLTEADFKNAKTEDELRQKASLPGVALEHLRFVKGEDGKWIPAAGTFDGWPEKLAELKMLDPCCGSGHFLVAAFLMLVPMRMEREGLSARQAVDRALSENIHGLELDQRCVELAALALALTGWSYPGAGSYRPLPKLNLACTGHSVGGSRIEWEKLANGNSKMRVALFGLYEEFKNASVLGSLICPTRGRVAKLIDWDDLAAALSKALEKERTDEQHEAGVVAHGLTEAARLLAGKYHWVITNVPYLARGKQSELLKDFITHHHYDARQDLATAFLDRILRFAKRGGKLGIVCPQNWLFLPAYSSFRNRLLSSQRFDILAKLGPRAFGTISGEVVNVALVVIEADDPSVKHRYGGLDVSSIGKITKKAEGLARSKWRTVPQKNALDSPDARISLEARGRVSTLGGHANSPQGIKTGDDGRFRRNWWEITRLNQRWRPFQGTPEADEFVGGMRYAIDWTKEGRDFARLQGKAAWGNRGVIVKLMGNFSFSLYNGELFDSNVTAIVPGDEAFVQAIWNFCLSPNFKEELSILEDGIKVNNATVVKVPFDLEHWNKVAEEKYPKGLPKPYSNDPTQWIFHGHPCGSVVWNDEKKWTAIRPVRTNATVLQVTVARLLGYRWPAELNAAMELSDEARAWVKRSQELLPFADDDGIVCIPPVRGEMKAEDRLENLLAAAYGSEWSSNKKAELLAQAGHAGKTLDTWLRDKFFTQHCKIFHHRPFIWHIWDGLRDGFAALVNYHKLDAKLLETLIYNYLGDWISRQKQGIGNGVDGAQEKLAAAEALKKKLELILKGEAPYDIFVRWKPIEKQPIGWNPDLNDGVQLNIRPFMTVGDVKKKGAGILRDKPNIKWGKDRGKDVPSAPWYHLGPIHGGNEGDRINDYHLGLEEKLAAKQQQEKDGQK